MFSFTISTDRRKWLAVRVPSGSVAIYRGSCFAYAGCDSSHFVVFPDKTISKISDLRDALECCVDYLEERRGCTHAMD